MSIGLLELPSDVFERIFAYLSLRDVLRFEAASTLCQHLALIHYWRGFSTLNLIAFLKSSKSGINLETAYKFDLVTSSLIKRVGGSLVSLSLSKFGPYEYGLRSGLDCAVIELCHDLQVLELNSRLLDKDMLFKIIKAMPELKSLSLNRLYVRSHGELDDCLLSELIKSLPNLQTLDVQDNRKLHLTRAQALPTSLVELNARNCYVRGNCVGDLLTQCPNLTTVNLMFQLDFRAIDANLLSKLRVISLDTHLRPASYAHLHAIGETMCYLIRCAVNLRCLTLSNRLVGDSVFKQVANSSKRLEQLTIFGSLRDHVAKPVASFSRIARLPNLHSISLNDSDSAWLFLTLCNKFNNLREIDVSYSLKYAAVKEADWDRVRSNSLKVFVARKFAPASANKRAICDNLFGRLKPNCPALEKVLI